jgi:polar amino acid transport system permease protein
MELILNWSDEFLWGTLLLIKTALGALALGMVWAVLGAIGMLSDNRVARYLSSGYSTVIRSIPELVVLLLIYYGGTMAFSALSSLWTEDGSYIEIGPMKAGIFALSLIFGAYASQVIRAAILAIPPGQLEAAQAIGMNRYQRFTRITLRQLWRYALPGLGNNWISLVKDTALISIIGLEDIMRVADMATAVDHKPFLFYSTALGIYMIINYGNTRLLDFLEYRANRGFNGV